MATNFGPVQSATVGEKGVYKTMRALKYESQGNQYVWQSKAKVNLVAGRPSEIICTSGDDYKDFYLLQCDDSPRYSINFAIPRTFRNAEVRYGDIDKDGDIDIAVKLTDGAIYVFHNLSK